MQLFLTRIGLVSFLFFLFRFGTHRFEQVAQPEQFLPDDEAHARLGLSLIHILRKSQEKVEGSECNFDSI